MTESALRNQLEGSGSVRSVIDPSDITIYPNFQQYLATQNDSGKIIEKQDIYERLTNSARIKLLVPSTLFEEEKTRCLLILNGLYSINDGSKREIESLIEKATVDVKLCEAMSLRISKRIRQLERKLKEDKLLAEDMHELSNIRVNLTLIESEK